MAKLFRNKKTFRWQPAVMELKNHIIMNGQAYNKPTLDPVPFKTIDINSYARSSLIGKSTWTYYASEGNWHVMGSSSMHGGKVGPNSFMVDDNDPTIGYIICPRDDAVTLRAHKINVNTLDVLVTGAAGLGSSGDYYAWYQDYPGQCYIVYQDDDYIYYIHKERSIRRETQGSTNRNDGACYLGWIDKTTMNQAGEDTFARMRNMLYLGNKGTTLFYIQTGVHWDTQYVDSRNYLNLYKFDSAIKTDTALVSHQISETFRTYGIASKAFNDVDDIHYGYWANRSDDSEEGYRLYKYEVDMNAETATVSGCTYDFGATDRATTLIRHDVSDYQHKVETFTCDDGSNKYVSFLVHETPGINAQTLDCFNIHTFLIGGDGSHLTYKSTATPGFRMRGIMMLEDDYSKFILFGDSHSEVWTWNSVNEEYDYTSTINMSCRGAMTDELNRLWMYDEQDNVHLISNNVPLTVTIDPEYTSYNYQGTTISSYVEVSAWDADSNRMETDVRLVLEGSTYFTDDSQLKEVTTASGSAYQVDIKITGTSFTRMFGSIVV